MSKEYPSGSETRKRFKVIRARVTPEEFDKIASDAQAAGVSVGGYLRMLGMGVKTPGTQPAAPLPELKELARVLGQLGKVGSNLNQLTKLGNQGQFVLPSTLAGCVAVVERATLEVCDLLASVPRPGRKSEWDD